MRLAPIWLFLLAAPLAAQTGTIPVTVFIAGGGEVLSGLELTITPLAGGASILVVTDSTGQARTSLSPGRYRIRSLNSLKLGGVEHTWDVEANVLSAYKALSVSLNRQNATSVGVAPPETTVVQGEPRRTAAPASSVLGARRTLRSGDPGYKDSGVALLLGLLVVGGGHMYSGETGKGLGMFFSTAALLGVGLATYEPYEDDNAVAGTAFGAAAIMMIVSVIDGAASASRANKKGAVGLSLGPVQLRPSAQGLAFSIPFP